ncbi:MAG TPA: TolC family protein [Gemmatirosa sp.]
MLTCSRLSAVRVCRGAALVVACAAAAVPRASSAQQPLRARVVTLPAALAAALRGNPDLVTARLREDSAQGERRIAAAVPNPTLGVVPNVPTQYSISEPIDLTPARLFRTRAARLGADATRLDEADARRTVSYAVRQGFYDVLLAQALRDVAAEQREALRQVLAADSVRLRDGDVPAQNVVRSELELARSDAALARATAQVHVTRLALQQLMGVATPDTGLGAAGTLRFVAVPVDTAGLRATALRERPDLRSAGLRVAQSRAFVSTARAQLVPIPEVSYVTQRHQRFDNGHFYSFGVGATLPFPYFFSGERARARAGLAAAQVAADRARLQVETDAATALDQYQASRALAERYEAGLLAKARQSVATARYAYRAGAISQLELLDALRTDADTRADYYNAVHDYWVGVFAVERAAGVELAGADAAADLAFSQ